ncbi:MAG: class II aldolase/adducin family protein, partial [Gemmatimonadota bacterium]
MGIPAFHYMVAVAGGDDIRCAPYATFGTAALSAHAVAALEGRTACLLAHHGILTLGVTPEAALATAVELEALAQMYVQARAAGTPAVLDAEEMARVLERFARDQLAVWDCATRWAEVGARLRRATDSGGDGARCRRLAQQQSPRLGEVRLLRPQVPDRHAEHVARAELGVRKEDTPARVHALEDPR